MHDRLCGELFSVSANRPTSRALFVEKREKRGNAGQPLIIWNNGTNADILIVEVIFHSAPDRPVAPIFQSKMDAASGTVR